MADKMLKALNTIARRLSPGDPVCATDDLSPHSFDDLKARGWIGSDEPPAAATGFMAADAGKGDGKGDGKQPA